MHFIYIARFKTQWNLKVLYSKGTSKGKNNHKWSEQSQDDETEQKGIEQKQNNIK